MDAARDRGRRLTAGAPFLLVNPRSGDREPSAEALADAARSRGIDVRLLGGGDDPRQVAREAAADGAAALGMAGGDGSLGAVASVAIDRDLPFACVPFGTRNHFARDLGLDGNDPIGTLAAFSGSERRVDVGSVGEIVFVNNVSLGLYAGLVHDPAPATKNRLRAGMRMFPAAFGRSRRPLDLTLDDGGNATRLRAFIVIVANNDYALDAISDLGGRSRLDEGRLHAYVVEAVGRFRLAVLLGRALAGRVGEVRGYTDHSAETLRVGARRPRIHVAVDGEPAVLAAPLDFRIRARALRVLVPHVARPER